MADHRTARIVIECATQSPPKAIPPEAWPFIAALVADLDARIAELTSALRPFAEWSPVGPTGTRLESFHLQRAATDFSMHSAPPTVGDLRRARDAFKEADNG